MKDWLRGRDLNPRSRSRGIMSRHGALSQSTEKSASTLLSFQQVFQLSSISQ